MNHLEGHIIWNWENKKGVPSTSQKIYDKFNNAPDNIAAKERCKKWKCEIKENCKKERLGLDCGPYNFSTANEINWTIGDSIKDGGKIDTILSSWDKLKVKIKNKNSTLNLRDNNKYPIAWLGFWKEIQFLWETKNEQWRLFLKVKAWEQEWWVSADFVEQSKTIDILPEKKPWEKEWENTNNTTSKETDSQNQEKIIPDNEDEAAENNTMQSLIQSAVLWDNGTIEINGNEYWIEEIQNDLAEMITPERLQYLKEELRPAVIETWMLDTITSIWSEKAQQVVDWLYWKNGIFGLGRNDDDIILNSISKIQNEMMSIRATLDNQEENPRQKIRTRMNKIFSYMQKAEAQETIIWSNDIENIQNSLYSGKDTDKKMLDIYWHMRYDAINGSGNSKRVKEMVASDLIKKTEFKDINDIIHNERIYDKIQQIAEANLLEKTTIKILDENGKEIWEKQVTEVFNELKKEIWKEWRKPEEWEELANKMIQIYQEMYSRRYRYFKKEYEKNNEGEISIREYNEKIHGERIEGGERGLKKSDMIASNIKSKLQKSLKHALLRKEIEGFENREKENESLIGMYADMSGLAEKKWWWWDYFDASDENYETISEFSKEVIPMLIPVGGWLLAANLAWKLLRLEEIQRKSMGLASTGIALGRMWTKWIVFYETKNLIENTIKWDSIKKWSVLSWDANVKEWIKSAAFFWLMRVLNKIPFIQKIWEIQIEKSMWALQKTLLNWWKMLNILTQAWLITGSAMQIDIAFGEDHDFTWKEYIQACIAVILFKKVEARTMNVKINNKNVTLTKTKKAKKAKEEDAKENKDDKKWLSIKSRRVILEGRRNKNVIWKTNSKKAKEQSESINNSIKGIKDIFSSKVYNQISSKNLIEKFSTSLKQSQRNFEVIIETNGYDKYNQDVKTFFRDTFIYYHQLNTFKKYGIIDESTLKEWVKTIKYWNHKIIPIYDSKLSYVSYKVLKQ